MNATNLRNVLKQERCQIIDFQLIARCTFVYTNRICIYKDYLANYVCYLLLSSQIENLTRLKKPGMSLIIMSTCHRFLFRKFLIIDAPTLDFFKGYYPKVFSLLKKKKRKKKSFSRYKID